MNIEELLAYSLDNELSTSQQAQLDNALTTSKDLQGLQDELFAMRNILEGHRPAKSETFVQGVLAQLPLQASRNTRILRLFPRVAAACILLIGATYLGLEQGNTNWISDEVVGTEYLSTDDALTYLDNFSN